MRSGRAQVKKIRRRGQERWEERHRDAVARGMTAIPDPYRITILRNKLVTEFYRQKFETKTWTSYASAREEIMGIARLKYQKAVENGLQDINMGGANRVAGTGLESQPTTTTTQHYDYDNYWAVPERWEAM